MATKSIKSPLLKGVKDITERFEMTIKDFYLFVGLGMPIRKINGRIYGHEENINEFLKNVTHGKTKNVSIDEIKNLFEDNVQE